MNRAGQYLNTLYLNTVFKYIYCIYTLYLNTFFNLYLITVFKYFWSVFKYMYLNTFLNTFLHTPLNINNRSSVDWSANHGFKHFNAVTCCICLLLNNTVPLMIYFPIEKVYLKHLIIQYTLYICTLYNTTLSFLALFCLRSKRVATCIMVRYVPHPISIQFVFH